jgi:orotidine-5'-phosphate decarboxylase
MSTETEFAPFFGAEKGVVWAADIEPDQFAPTMEQLGDVIGLVGVKIGFEVGLGLGLKEATNIVRSNAPDAAVQYDHQKAGNDIPDTGKNYAATMIRGGVDSAILFPFASPKVEQSWIDALQGSGINVFVGSEMTTEGFQVSEGGYVTVDTQERIFDIALEKGVRNFIVPGNKAASVLRWREFIERVVPEGEYALAAPGFVDQGGDITEAAEVAGKFWTPIIGRGIHANLKMTPKEAVQFYVSQLRSKETT